MNFLEIIEKKKMGKSLSREEIRAFAQAAATGSVPDYQLSALLMAIRLNGMDMRETADLTLEMAATGDELEPNVGGMPIDKHSTGGVGDTTTLILAPLVAACGGKVLKMSGRGLGHTGGTLDKLESISGMKTVLPEEVILSIVREIGCAVVGQSAELAPADKRLYALRDVTATVDSVPLIAASILSKKFASGAKAIVLDVKTGQGALMRSYEDSLKLAQAMVSIGEQAGHRITAVISDMQEPLGSHVGNALEVKEAIDALAGRVPESAPLIRVSLFLGAQMLLLSDLATDEADARAKLLSALRNGAGLQKLKQMISAQGGDARVCDDVRLLPAAPILQNVPCPMDGFLAGVDCTALGYTAQRMGAGRATKEDTIDPAVGFVMMKRIGDACQKGEPLCVLHARTEESAKAAEASVLRACLFSKTPSTPAPLIHALVDASGVRAPDESIVSGGTAHV